MNSAFWTNTVWYVLLGITSLVSIAAILHKSKNRKFHIAFILAVLALSYHIEAIFIYPFSEAYSYYPKLLKHAFLDTVNGNYFSQASIATSLVLLAVYKLGTIWSFIFAAVYYLIEVLFLKLGIYQHHWYKIWLTPAGFALMSFLVRKWYNKMLYSPKSWVCYITLYLATVTSFGHTLTIFIYSGIRVIHYNFFPDVFKDQLSGVILQMFILINIMINLYRSKVSWLTKGIVFIGLSVIQYILCKTGVMYIKPGWFFIVTAVDLFGCYFGVAAMDYLIREGLKQ